MKVFRSGAEGDRLARHLRLFEIDRLIRDGQYPNATRLARDCCVTRKTIQRDLDTLRWEMGAPIVYDARRRGYCYAEPGYSLPAVTVTEQELFALVVAERAIDNYVGTPLETPLRKAFAKLRGCLSPDTGAKLGLAPENIHFVGTPGPTITAETWNALHLAIRERRTVAMRVYVAYRNQEVERRIDPYAMLVKERDWYVIGHEHRSGQFPYFYLPRIRALRLTDDTFEVRSDFDLKRILAAGFAGMAGDGRPRTVKIRFTRAVAEQALERPWSLKQTHKKDRQGRVIITFETDALFQVVRQVLAWGANAEVLEPKELRQWVQDVVRQLAAIYR